MEVVGRSRERFWFSWLIVMGFAGLIMRGTALVMAVCWDGCRIGRGLRFAGVWAVFCWR